jgi:hypothetical protein
MRVKIFSFFVYIFSVSSYWDGDSNVLAERRLSGEPVFVAVVERWRDGSDRERRGWWEI